MNFLETPAVFRAPSGFRGFVSRIGIGHVLEADVEGKKWQLDEPDRKGALFKLVIDGQTITQIDRWPRAWVDTVRLRHLERDRPDRRIDSRRPIDIAASPNGPTLVVVDEAGVVVHDLEMRLRRTVAVLGQASRVHAVAVDQGGVRVAAGFGHYAEDEGSWVDGTVRIFRVMDGSKEVSFMPERERIHALAFTVDGDRVVSACGQQVRVHRAWDQRIETVLQRRTEDDVAFSPRGNTFITIEAKNDLALWEVRDRGARRSVIFGDHPNVTALAFGLGGALLATANHEDIRIWDLRTMALAWTLPRPAETIALAFTPRADKLLYGGWTEADPYRRKPVLAVVDAHDGRTMLELHGHTDAPNAIAVDATGQFAVSASFEGPVRVWRLSDGQCVRMLDAKAHAPARVAFVNNGTEIALLADQLTRWRLEDGSRIERLPTRSGAPYGGDIANRKDGTRVGLSRAGALVELAPSTVVPPRNRGILDVSPDGALVAKTVEQGDLVLTETKEGKELLLHAPSSSGAAVLATSPDGIHYATGDRVAARLYRLGATEPSAMYPTKNVTALAFGAGDATWLAIGREDGFVEVRDIANGTVVASIDLRSGDVRSLAFRGDGRVLAVATSRSVCLLLTNEWQEIASWDSSVIQDPLKVAWAVFRLVVADNDGCLVFEYPDDRPPPRR